jgi:hypothetical protein
MAKVELQAALGDLGLIYRACLNTALALRNGIGEDGLKKLQEAAEDY